MKKSILKKSHTKSEVDLRKLKRIDLLEMLVEQGKETEALRRRVAELEKQLEDRKILLDQAGNIAQASLEINRVMEAAQAAAQQYLDNVTELCRRKEEEAIARCEAKEKAMEGNI